MEGVKKEVHVLMVSLSMHGTVVPMLRLAEILLSKGLHVTFLVTNDFSSNLRQAGINMPVHHNLIIEFFDDGFTDDSDRENHADRYFNSLPIDGSGKLNVFIHENVRKFSCIINNPYVPWVVNVAERHNIPCAMLWTKSCGIYSIYYRYFKDPKPFPTMEKFHIKVNLPGIPLLDVYDIPSYIHPCDQFPEFRKGLRDMINSLKYVKWVLGNSFYELEKDIVDSMDELHPIIPIGPLVPPTKLGRDEEHIQGGVDADIECLQWLDHKRPSSVVYISFSFMLSNKELENIALALKSLPIPFLWVLESPWNERVDRISDLPCGFIEEIRGQGLVVPWCSRTRVLAHPSIACFMSDCDWNSTLEAVTSGVPMLGLAKWKDDQAVTWKLMVHVFRNGLGLSDERLGIKDVLMEKIYEITLGRKAGELKGRAMELRKASRMALANDGSSDRNLQIFIDEIGGLVSLKL